VNAFWNNFRNPPTQNQVAGARLTIRMQHLVTARTIVGSGEDALVLEVKGGSVRIKRRGMPELFLPLDAAREVAEFLRLVA
jgi:hypothetical protein